MSISTAFLKVTSKVKMYLHIRALSRAKGLEEMLNCTTLCHAKPQPDWTGTISRMPGGGFEFFPDEPNANSALP